MKKVLISMLMACTLTVSTLSTVGCWGSFGLTKKMYDINKGLGSKWISWIVFFIIGGPVTGISLFIDSLLLNTIEFWTGAKLISTGDTYQETDANGNSVTAVKMEDGSLYMRVDTATGETKELVLQRDEETIRILDAKGNLLKEAAYAE
jgi:hypothetical protein